MDDNRTSFIVFSLNLIPPNAPTLGHFPVPSLPGPKTPHLQLKIRFVIIPNGPLRWHFQQPQCVQDPTNLTQTSNESIKTTPTRYSRSTPAKCSMMESPRCGLLYCGSYCALLYSHFSKTNWAFLSRSPCFVSDNNQQHHLSSISNTMANRFSRLLPAPHDIMATQPWEQPTDLTQAKDLLSRLCSSIIRRARTEFFHPKSKIQRGSLAYPHRLVQDGARNPGQFDHIWTRQRHPLVPSSQPCRSQW